MSKRWYVVHTYSGYENRVKSDLEHRIETMGMQDRIFDIEIPMERVTEIKEGGKRETKDSKIFPGYVLVRMEMDDDAWTCVRNTPGVTGFLGGNGKPAPIVKAPFYGFRATAVLLSTYCGPKIDSQARVINIFGEPIEGLWAAGEGTGGLHGAAYMSGTSVGKSVVFGKIAAESIAGKQ